MSELSTIEDRLEQCARRVEMGARTTIDGIMVAGQALAEARAEFGDNDKAFGKWREQRLPWLKKDTAARFIRVWHTYGLQQQNAAVETMFRDVGQSVLYLLTAPSTPETARTEVEQRAEEGERMTVEKVKEIVAKAKAEERAKADQTIKDLKQQVKETATKFKDEKKAVDDKMKKLRMERDAAQAQFLQRDHDVGVLDSRIFDLKVELDHLRSQRGTVETTIVKEMVEVIPPGYASVAEAISAKETELQALLRRQQVEQSRLRQIEEEREDAEREARAALRKAEVAYALFAFDAISAEAQQEVRAEILRRTADV